MATTRYKNAPYFLDAFKPARGMTTGYPELKGFLNAVLDCDTLKDVADVFESFATKLAARGAENKRGTWRYFLERQAKVYRAGNIPGDVFKKGNGKLPFVTFSTLPDVTCPGAGACLSFCYSFKAFRYPAALLRQLANTLRLRFAKRSIIEAFRKIRATNRKGKRTTVRLYVDGDFDSVETAVFWFGLIRQRPELIVYGYSKSWEILETVERLVPENYVLNLSSGSKYADDGELAERLAGRSFVRGFYVAVKTEHDHGTEGMGRYATKAYHDDVRQSMVREGYGKGFSCVGPCGQCRVSAGLPACADKLFNVTIGNGVH